MSGPTHRKIPSYPQKFSIPRQNSRSTLPTPAKIFTYRHPLTSRSHKHRQNEWAKLFAIGELVKFRGGEPSLDEGRVKHGLGDILTDLAEDLRKGPKPSCE